MLNILYSKNLSSSSLKKTFVQRKSTVKLSSTIKAKWISIRTVEPTNRCSSCLKILPWILSNARREKKTKKTKQNNALRTTTTETKCMVSHEISTSKAFGLYLSWRRNWAKFICDWLPEMVIILSFDPGRGSSILMDAPLRCLKIQRRWKSSQWNQTDETTNRLSKKSSVLKAKALQHHGNGKEDGGRMEEAKCAIILQHRTKASARLSCH